MLDEATANVDENTDALIQAKVRDKFVGCSVLTIAHRLNTIMDYDKVVVLAEGHVIEQGVPGTLAQDQTTHFAGMLKSH
jgi:ABC-type multidrug transport system fused ATPase/permease subunit